MEADTGYIAQAARRHVLAHEASAEPAVDLHCRVCELETENGRLRLLVGELLVLNQRLREAAKVRQPESA
ncbi:MAG TPA: hypothetical protein VME86_05085 [Acidobacteriaceae bacterium]|nr:hypothetical protein [Acidobacteriaceae bacterium]